MPAMIAEKSTGGSQHISHPAGDYGMGGEADRR